MLGVTTDMSELGQQVGTSRVKTFCDRRRFTQQRRQKRAAEGATFTYETGKYYFSAVKQESVVLLLLLTVVICFTGIMNCYTK